MKNTGWMVIIFILAVMLFMEFRYTLVVNSPIVAKIDRITGDVWVANSGMWVQVKHPVEAECVTNCSVDTKQAEQPAEKASTEKTK